MGYFRRFLTDVQITIDDQIAEGDKVASWVTFRGTHTGDFGGIGATGKWVECRGLAMDRLSDSEVIEMWHEADLHGLIRQLEAG